MKLSGKKENSNGQDGTKTGGSGFVFLKQTASCKPPIKFLSKGTCFDRNLRVCAGESRQENRNQVERDESIKKLTERSFVMRTASISHGKKLPRRLYYAI